MFLIWHACLLTSCDMHVHDSFLPGLCATIMLEAGVIKLGGDDNYSTQLFWSCPRCCCSN
jgi:hypothetical protein